jgi:hypothetical protein
MATTVSLLNTGTNTHKETVEKFNLLNTYFASDGILPQCGTIADATPDTGPFAIQAQGTPDMTLTAKSTGTPYAAALITGTPTSGVSQKVIVQLTADETITIASNTSGSTKYDWIYVKLDPDKMKDPNVAASDVASLYVSRSTSNSVDAGAPTHGLHIATVTVTNGASSITNANIVDRRTYARQSIEILADSAITTAKIADENITLAKMAPGGMFFKGADTRTADTQKAVANCLVSTYYYFRNTADSADLAITFTKELGADDSNLLIEYSASLWCPSGNANLYIAPDLDGTLLNSSPTHATYPANSPTGAAGHLLITNSAAGSHTVKLKFANTAGTITITYDSVYFRVYEVRK